MALTKAVASLQGWTAVAAASGTNMVESATYNCAPNYETALQIQAFLTNETAHVGTEFIVQVSSNTTDDEDWSDLCRFTELVNSTPYYDQIRNDPLQVGATGILISSTTGFLVADLPGAWRGISDTTNSELVFQIGVSSNQSITILDGVKYQHAVLTYVNNTAFSRDVQIPFWASRTRVIVNNGYDVNGATLLYKVRAYSVTAVS